MRWIGSAIDSRLWITALFASTWPWQREYGENPLRTPLLQSRCAPGQKPDNPFHYKTRLVEQDTRIRMYSLDFVVSWYTMVGTVFLVYRMPVTTSPEEEGGTRLHVTASVDFMSACARELSKRRLSWMHSEILRIWRWPISRYLKFAWLVEAAAIWQVGAVLSFPGSAGSPSPKSQLFSEDGVTCKTLSTNPIMQTFMYSSLDNFLFGWIATPLQV